MNNKANTVYVPQETSLPIAQATAYGTIKALLPMNKQLVFGAQPMLRELRNQPRNFSDADYILPLGGPVAIAMATVAAMEANRGVVNFLVYDKKLNNGLGGYYTVKVDFHAKMERASES